MLFGLSKISEISMSGIKKVLFLFLFFTTITSSGQETPVNPVSNKVITPYVFNPAITGSKDFLSVDLLAALQDKQYTQLIGVNARIRKKGHNFLNNRGPKEFSNIGIGGYAFNDLAGNYRNAGISIAGAYHIPLGREKLSFISLGAAGLGVFSHFQGDADAGIPEKDTIFPNLNAGIYFYNPSFYAGISANNILTETTSGDSIPVTREYFFNTGFKVVLSRRHKIVIEPSVIFNMGDTLSDNIRDMVHPGLKLYLGNFCMGTYINDYERIPFFFQYKYPGFYIGTFFELPRNTPFYKKEITAELVLGFNITGNKSGYSRKGQW